MKCWFFVAVLFVAPMAFGDCELMAIYAGRIARHDLQQDRSIGRVIPSPSGNWGVVIDLEVAQVWNLKEPSPDTLLPWLHPRPYLNGNHAMSRAHEEVWLVIEKASGPYVAQFSLARGDLLQERPWHPSDGTPYLLSENQMLVALPSAFAGAPKKRLMEIWDPQTFERTARLLDPTPADIKLAIGCPKDMTLALDFANGDGRLIDLATGHTLSSMPGSWTASAFSPDGKYFAAAFSTGGLEVIDVQKVSSLASLSGDRLNPYRQVLFHPSREATFLVNEGSKISLWKKAPHVLTSLGMIEAQRSRFVFAALSADGKLLATSLSSGLILIWEHDRLTPVAQLVGKHDLVHDLHFNREGTRIFATTTGAELVTWEIPSLLNTEPLADKWSSADHEIRVKTVSDGVRHAVVSPSR